MARDALELAFRHAIGYLDGLDGSPAARVDLGPELLRKRLAKSLCEGVAPPQVVRELIDDAQKGLLGSAGGRFFGWVRGGCLTAALAADWLNSVWDQNAALYTTAPAAAIVEEVVGEWLKEVLHISARASFALVTGCQMAHVTCLAAARHALLAEHGQDVERDGLFDVPPLRILSSEERHASLDRAVRLLGLGSRHIVDLAVDRDGRLSQAALERALQDNGKQPSIVVLRAGDVNTGAFDDFRALVPVAQRYGAWVHLDGAFGLWVASSTRYRDLLEGADGADSWAADGHKWLNVPYDCGYAFVAKAEAHRASMSHRAPYVTPSLHARDEIDWNPEWSRRARGFGTYAALRQLGLPGIAELVERCCGHAESLVAQIGALEGAEIVWKPVINQGMVRFLAHGAHATGTADDRWTEEVIRRIALTGEAFFSGTTWRGRRVMRISVCNWQTGENDVSRAVRAVASVLANLESEVKP